MTDKIHIKCPACGKGLSVASKLIGKSGKCPGCSNKIIIRLPDAQNYEHSPATPPPPPRQTTPLDSTEPELAYQPTHGEEFSQDKRRIAHAVSAAPDKYELVEPYLMKYEEPLAIAVQRKFPFSMFSDVVLLSSHRLMVFKRFFTKIDMFDVNYVDFNDVTIKQGFFTSSLRISDDNGRVCSVSRLITNHALNIYRLCQDIETKARIARRQFQLEENRSRTTQMQVNNLVADPESRSIPQASRSTSLLQNRNISDVGDEESNPYRLGE